VLDHCVAIDQVVRRGRLGATYLVGGRSERRNIDIAKEICVILDELRPRASGKHEELLTSVTDRLGHDFRYAINCSLIEEELEWKATETFASGIRKTVDWYLANPEHLERHS
jgi:dTDP-glucose 4,6-dehydratase